MSDIKLPKGYRNPDLVHKKYHTDDENLWVLRGHRRALELFYEMSERVPAYADFLKKHNVKPLDIKSIKDFHKIPVMDKDNYLREYPRKMLCWDGKFADDQWVISTTSGSTGKPYYFPRQKTQEWQYAICAEQYLRNNFNIQKYSTLYIIAFPMGAWIGGVFTYEALKLVADNSDYKLGVVTAGISKRDVINAVKELGDDYDQIIIGSYAPFLKDILEDGKREGIDWRAHKIGFIFSAEAFSEAFRDYVAGMVGPESVLRFSLNHYGTVDLGTMAHETPETVLLRRELVDRNMLDVLLPEKDRQPTLCQYDPQLFYFEETAGNLLCSAYSGIPLMRYNLKDYGGLIKRSTAHKILARNGISMPDLLKKNKLNDITWKLPYLYVYERNDFSVSYYAFLVYPEMIRRALIVPSVTKLVTGKFTMVVDYAKNGRQQLKINVEKEPGVKDDAVTKKISVAVHESLLKYSSEYGETYKMIGEQAKPIVIPWEYEDQKYFKPGAKQKWVIK